MAADLASCGRPVSTVHTPKKKPPRVGRGGQHKEQVDLQPLLGQQRSSPAGDLGGWCLASRSDGGLGSHQWPNDSKPACPAWTVLRSEGRRQWPHGLTFCCGTLKGQPPEVTCPQAGEAGGQGLAWRVPEDEMARGRREDKDLQGLVILERVSSLCDIQELRVCSMPKRIW
jgi:hypothetical protein